METAIGSAAPHALCVCTFEIHAERSKVQVLVNWRQSGCDVNVGCRLLTFVISIDYRMWQLDGVVHSNGGDH